MIEFFRKYKIEAILHLLLYIVLCASPGISFASGNICVLPCVSSAYGKSCSGFTADTQAINSPIAICSNSPYCYILNYINIKPTSCNDDSNSITLDVKTSINTTSYNASTPVITVTINHGSPPVSVSSLFTGSDIALDPIIGRSQIWVSNIGSSKICLYTNTVYGPQPLVCKAAPTSFVPPPPTVSTSRKCSVASKTCYDPDFNHSRSIFNFSGVAYQCLTETLDRTFYLNTPACTTTDGVNTSLVNIFVNFQNALRNSVAAALTLYVIFFGIKILLGEIEMKLSSAATFIMKIILVFYFSVGLGPVTYVNGNATQSNGVVTWILPLFKEVGMDLATIVLNAGSEKELCKFHSSDYPEGYGYYSTWDSLDCRIAYYFGLGAAWGRGDELRRYTPVIKPSNVTAFPQLNSSNGNTPSIFNESNAFLFFRIISGLINGGFIMLMFFSLISVLIFASILIGMVSSVLVCTVTLYIMVYISPIFVPMVLFQNTKGYFSAWVRILFSMALQPMVLLGFVAFVMIIFDSFLYNGCSFLVKTYSIPSHSGLVTREFDFFQLGYIGSDNTCKQSPAYSLYKYYSGKGWIVIALVFFEFSAITNPVADFQSSIFLLFFISVIFYFAAQIIVDLASELTSGPNVKAVSIGAGSFMNVVLNGAITIARAVATKGQSLKDDAKKMLKDQGKKMGLTKKEMRSIGKKISKLTGGGGSKTSSSTSSSSSSSTSNSASASSSGSSSVTSTSSKGGSS